MPTFWYELTTQIFNFTSMFTGLIEETGHISEIRNIDGGKKIKITASEVLEGLKIDDSVAVNGVCLTTVKLEKNSFWVDAVGETLNKTTLAEIKKEHSVNLERAMRLGDRLGGHIVQGHVNGIATISDIKKLGENYSLQIDLPKELLKYVVNEGSISIDGISLTVALITNKTITISVIPHTWVSTNLKIKKVGDKVNIETDIIAKYIENFLKPQNDNKQDRISIDWLKSMGY